MNQKAIRKVDHIIKQDIGTKVWGCKTLGGYSTAWDETLKQYVSVWTPSKPKLYQVVNVDADSGIVTVKPLLKDGSLGMHAYGTTDWAMLVFNLPE